MRRIRDVALPVRILLVDDHTFLHGVLRELVGSYDRFELCGEAITSEGAVRACKDLRPDAVLLDISTPETSGLDAARLVRAIDYPSAIVVVSANRNAQLLREARQGGTQNATRSEAGAAITEAIENAPIGEFGAATYYMDQPPVRVGRAKAARASA